MRLRKLSPFLSTLGVLFATLAVEPQNAPALAGRWEGTLIPQVQGGSRDLSSRANRPRLPTVVIITTARDGTHSGTWSSTSRWSDINAIIEIKIDGDTIRIGVANWSGSWEGTLSSDGSRLNGRWTQGGLTSPLVLKKVGTE